MGQAVIFCYCAHRCYSSRGGRGGGLPYTTNGDACRNFQKEPLKVTIWGVAPANFIPKKLPRKFLFIEITQEY